LDSCWGLDIEYNDQTWQPVQCCADVNVVVRMIKDFGFIPENVTDSIGPAEVQWKNVTHMHNSSIKSLMS
jgi:hypothetical protein